MYWLLYLVVHLMIHQCQLLVDFEILPAQNLVSIADLPQVAAFSLHLHYQNLLEFDVQCHYHPMTKCFPHQKQHYE